MKNLKIGTKIYLGFSLILLLLLSIAVLSVFSINRTRTNIDKVDIYNGLQSSANELMHILNETRITARVFYATHSAQSFSDLNKQLQYCDLRLTKLYEYIDANADVQAFRADIEQFESLYRTWRNGVVALGDSYAGDEALTAGQQAIFQQQADDLRKVNLLCHELLSNTALDMDDTAKKTMLQTKEASFLALWFVVAISAFSLLVAAAVAMINARSITRPLKGMRDVLIQIGQSGNLKLSSALYQTMETVAAGKDETAQCTQALLVLVNRLHDVDKDLDKVAGGDLTGEIALQSPEDTMGLAVQKMIANLDQKFSTLVKSTEQVSLKTKELSDGAQLLSSGSEHQAESVQHLSASVVEVGQRTEQNTALAAQATELIARIQQDAQAGTEKMNEMIQAAADINTASKAINTVIKTIDDIAFQTNILALNAAVEAARAGQHGKGFAVVADEVRNLANKSAAAAKDTTALIEDTIQKAALGSRIALDTSAALQSIVEGVTGSNTVIASIHNLSAEQLADVQQIISDVKLVESIVQQNNAISATSAVASTEIAEQINLLNELVAQFRLRSGQKEHAYLNGGNRYEVF